RHPRRGGGVAARPRRSRGVGVRERGAGRRARPARREGPARRGEERAPPPSRARAEGRRPAHARRPGARHRPRPAPLPGEGGPGRGRRRGVAGGGVVRRSAQSGQATIELLGGLPLVLAFGLVALQLLAVGYAAVLAGVAAEAGALAYAGGADAE